MSGRASGARRLSVRSRWPVAVRSRRPHFFYASPCQTLPLALTTRIMNRHILRGAPHRVGEGISFNVIAARALVIGPSPWLVAHGEPILALSWIGMGLLVVVATPSALALSERLRSLVESAHPGLHSVRKRMSR